MATWSLDEEFDAVPISIDPRETPGATFEHRGRVLTQDNRPSAARGWHFLTGSESQIRRIAEAVGFQDRYDRAQDQYAHPAVTMLLIQTEGLPATCMVSRTSPLMYGYGCLMPPGVVRSRPSSALFCTAITTTRRVRVMCSGQCG